MKKALLIKLESPFYSSIGMERAFKEHFEVHSIDWQAIRFNNGYNGLQAIWETILNECATFKPDLIFIQLQVDYILNTDQFRELGRKAFVINYTEDVRENIKWIEDAAPHIGLTVFTNMDDVEKLKDKGIDNVAYMPVSYNDIWYRPVPKTDKYYGDIIFVGNNTVNSNLNFPYAQERMDMVKFMKEKFGDRFRSYGMAMEYSMLSPAEVIQAYSNCKVVITQNQFKKRGYFSDRGMNAIGCGSIVIHQNFEGIENVFKDFTDLFVWHSLNELYEICESILRTDKYIGHQFEDNYRDKVSSYAKENHSWSSRIKYLIELTKIYHEKQNSIDDGVWISDDNSPKVSFYYNKETLKPESSLYHFK